MGQGPCTLALRVSEAVRTKREPTQQVNIVMVTEKRREKEKREREEKKRTEEEKRKMRVVKRDTCVKRERHTCVDIDTCVKRERHMCEERDVCEEGCEKRERESLNREEKQERSEEKICNHCFFYRT